MSSFTKCPKCTSENIYDDGNLWICPECSHEWSALSSQNVSESDAETQQAQDIKDAHGNILENGDSVIVLKDLKIKGSSMIVKGGTKVRNIRLTEALDGHNLACKIDGIGAINLKSEFVKKA